MDIDDLDDAMDAMSESLARRGDVGESLNRIVAAATETVPGADYASITVRHPNGRLETVASTDSTAVHADELQYELREGPCYDAVTVDSTTYSRDLSSSSAWPNFGPKIASEGQLSQMGVRLSNDEGTVTGLNLYSTQRNAFADSEPLTRLFASHARVAMGFATELQTLKGAIGTRETIGTAIGIVMERYGLTKERAFEFLIRISQNSNTKLRDVAADVVRLKPRANGS
jgi:ANTAR domain/GAF domain